MIQAVLFDLDDTLLGNNIDAFMQRYFDLLARYAQPMMPREPFLRQLLASTKATILNTDTSLTNREVFWREFCRLSQLDQVELEPFFHHFYETDFHDLQPVTNCRPAARQLVQYCRDQGVTVVVATNPLFPRVAIEKRLEWAGVPVAEFSYALVTTYENMHATKPHLAYYEEILAQINCPPAAALMVGDDWKMDIVPAKTLGLQTYWITSAGENGVPDANLVHGQGTLDDLLTLFQVGWLQRLWP